MQRVRVVDSHTEGEPTRVVVGGMPELGGDSLAEKAVDFRDNHGGFRTGVVLEPRGYEAVVGALLLESSDCDCGVIFFNNVSVLGMCGHGTIGLVRTLEYLGRIGPGEVRIDTPVGVVGAILHEDGRVTISNVPSYRYRTGVSVEVEGYGEVVGDIAYGGNWFFAAGSHGQELSLRNLDGLTRFTTAIRRALERDGVEGEDGGLIDHIELFGSPGDPSNHSRNFVLCPGLAYDRSPCGTGTSAKLACLAADGKLRAGEAWRQESVIGSVFEGRYEVADGGRITPFVTGRAFVTADSELLFDEGDPFREGIRAS